MSSPNLSPTRYSPLIETMLQKHALPLIDESNLNAFLSDHSVAVLFFAEDPKRYPETNDVAMVLPEILKQFDGMAGAMVDASFEHALQSRFDFTRWPALAFFRDGQYVGAITGIQNWEDYLQQIQQLLDRYADSGSGSAIPVMNL